MYDILLSLKQSRYIQMSSDPIDPTFGFKLTPLQYDSKMTFHARPNHQEQQVEQSFQLEYSHQKINIDIEELHGADPEQKTNRQMEKYLDMYKLNPDWKFAEIHGVATKPGIYDSLKADKCICCLRRIKTQPLPLCQNSKELQFLGHGFPLFYIFVKYAMIILLMQILNYSIMELYIAISQNYTFCIDGVHKKMHGQEVLCTSFMVLFSNISEQITGLQLVLRATSFFTLLASLVYVRDIFTKTWMYYDERKKTYANFSIIIEYLPTKQELGPTTLTIGQRLRQFFEDETIFPSNPRVVKINLQGELEYFTKLEDEIGAISSQMGKIKRELQDLSQGTDHERDIHRTQLLTKRLQDAEQSKAKAESELSREKSRLKKLINNQDLNCDKAIVCFQTEQERIAVQKAFKKISKEQLRRHFTDKGIEVQMSKAPEPREINWKFLNVPQSVRMKRRFLSWAIFVLMLTVLTVGIYFLFTYTAHKIQTAQQAQEAAAIELTYIFGIVLFNKFVLVYVIHHLVDFQMHRTGETYQFSLMFKYALGLFFTTAVIALLVEGAVRKNVYTEEYGIAEEETIMFFLITFLVPLIWLINPWYLVKLVQRKLKKDSEFLTQTQANELMQDPEYLMGKRYAQILQSFWFTFLYACLLPFGSILIFFWLGFYYWVDKYNLLRRSSISQGVSGDLCMKALFLLEFILVLKPTGELIFDSLLRHQWHVFSVVEVCIGTLYIVLPIGKILKFFHVERFLSAQVTYSQLLERQSRSYELYNPITKQDELKKILQITEESSMVLSEGPNTMSERLLVKKHRFMRPHYSPRRNNDIEANQQSKDQIRERNKVEVQPLS